MVLKGRFWLFWWVTQFSWVSSSLYVIKRLCLIIWFLDQPEEPRRSVENVFLLILSNLLGYWIKTYILGFHPRTTISESLDSSQAPQVILTIGDPKRYVFLLFLCFSVAWPAVNRIKNIYIHIQGITHLVKASIENFPNFRSFKSNSLKIPTVVIVEIC